MKFFIFITLLGDFCVLLLDTWSLATWITQLKNFFDRSLITPGNSRLDLPQIFFDFLVVLVVIRGFATLLGEDFETRDLIQQVCYVHCSLFTRWCLYRFC